MNYFPFKCFAFGPPTSWITDESLMAPRAQQKTPRKFFSWMGIIIDEKRKRKTSFQWNRLTTIEREEEERNFVIAGTSRQLVNSTWAALNLRTIIIIVFRGLNMIFNNCNNKTGFHLSHLAAPKSTTEIISLKRPGRESKRKKEIEFSVLSHLTAIHKQNVLLLFLFWGLTKKLC